MTDTQRLTEINQQLLFIIGTTLPLVMQWKSRDDQEEQLRKWIIDAIEAVVYRNESLPEFPY